MRLSKSLPTALFAAGAVLFLTANLFAADTCCECGSECKLKKVYRCVVTFKLCKFQCWDYTTVCKDVFIATTTCCKKCGECDGKCDCPGRPVKKSVLVAVPSKCRECVRKVPVVTWVVECRCETCCKKCKHGHHH
jgi:hypothetical protein